jgi:hypothetical protein
MNNTFQARPNLIYPVCIFCLVFSGITAAILWLNQGHFIYSLDDPYIHLALAENIARGHYGVNLSEYSAPSSSILWPYLLAPFTLPGWDEFAPLIISMLAGLLSFIVIMKMLEQWIGPARKPLLLLAVFFALGTNLIGVIFTGMEHNLQILCSVLALYGIFRTETDQRVPWWLYLVLILGPLVRYENSLISLIAGLYLLSRAYWWQTIITGAISLALLAAFSLYLHSMDLGYIASSIMVKSSNEEQSLQYRLLINQLSAGGILMWFAWFSLIVTLFKNTVRFERLLAALALLALSLHFIAGRFGWFGRYEIYMMIPVLMVLIYCHRTYLADSLSTPLKHPFLLFYALLFLLNYGSILIKTPISANNIYDQQYQMHRFVTDYYPHPLAVNDLGWVSYRNDNYVLDLWGLASSEAFEMRLYSSDARWMADLSNRHQVRLAIIYHHDQWFKDIPEQWQLLAIMKTSLPRMIIGSSDVHFYAADKKYTDEIRTQLQNFSPTLPEGTSISIY